MKPRQKRRRIPVKTTEQKIVDNLIALHGYTTKQAWQHLKRIDLKIDMQFINLQTQLQPC